MQFYYGSLILSNCLLVLSVLVGIWKRSALNITQKWYLGYLGYMMIIELVAKLLIFVLEVRSTYALYPFYVSGEFLLLSFMFLTGFEASRKWYVLCVLAGILVFAKAMLGSSGGHTINNIDKICAHLAIICLAGYSLLRGLKQFKKENKLLPVYACLFLYYSLSLFLFLLLNQLSHLAHADAYVIWGMNNILSAILYGTSIYIFWTSNR